jgi:ABC-2 type transport system permease protein
MMQELTYQLRVIWGCAMKDLKVALTERVFTIISLFLPVNVLILMSLFVLAGSNAPTAVVMLDQGPYAEALYTAMSQAHSFRLQRATPDEAQRLLETGRIVAVVTIPQDFDARVQGNQAVQVDVQINNINTDFTNDIRRAIPLSITSFYATVFPKVVSVTPHEIDFYPTDTDYIPYLSVSILVIALMIGGLLQSGTSAASEWENNTIKELLLSPASRWAIMLGKMLGAFLAGLGSSIIVLVVLVFVVGVQPRHWIEVIAFALLTQIIFIAAGTLLAALIKQRQPVIALAFGTALPLFFLSGAFGPISFTTPLLQLIARIFPVYYAIVAMQHAFHDFTLNTYSLFGNVLILLAYTVGLIAVVTVVLRRSTVAH